MQIKYATSVKIGSYPMLLYCHIRISKTTGLLHIFLFDYIAQNGYDVITERIKRGPKSLYLTICSWELLHIAFELNICNGRQDVF